MDGKVNEQILAIRDTGLTNMFDTGMVQKLAFERGFFELVCFLEDHLKDYVRFILYGDEGTEK
ncbi:MAG: DUF5049 domain-containing protein [Anaerolineaceae bacterium]|nr:DUF5049 domain-containing protein [Anaerolineaceae bacterium]